MNIGIIIQARLGSSRLPGKSLMHIDSSYSVLEYVINQLTDSGGGNPFEDQLRIGLFVNF